MLWYTTSPLDLSFSPTLAQALSNSQIIFASDHRPCSTVSGCVVPKANTRKRKFDGLAILGKRASQIPQDVHIRKGSNVTLAAKTCAMFIQMH